MSDEQDPKETTVDESDAKIAEFLAKSKRRKLGTASRARLAETSTDHSAVREPETGPIEVVKEVDVDTVEDDAANPQQKQSPSFELKADPSQSLAVSQTSAPEQAPVESISKTYPEIGRRDPVFWADENEQPKNEHLKNELGEHLKPELQTALPANADTYAPPPSSVTKRKRAPKTNPVKKSKGGFWSFIKSFYKTFGVLVFLGAAALVLINFSKPWLQVWLKNERPAITLPSVANLKAMPANERMRLKNSAIRLAPFREKRLVSDPVPFEGGRPTELDQFRLRAIGDGVEIAGLLRLYEMPDKRQFLRLTDFEITAGYDLRILLSAHANPKTKADLDEQGYVDLAALKGENGPQNYLLPKTFELEDFGSFVIYDQLFEIVYAISIL